MSTLETIAQRLVAEKGLVPVESILIPAQPGEDDQPVALPRADFLGLRYYWGSLMTVGLLAADGLGVSEIQARAKEMNDFTRAIKGGAGSLDIQSLFGATSIALGSFGTLCFVFERPCPAELLREIRDQKRGSAAGKDYLVCWAVDIPAGKVHRHRWLPLTMFPGRRYLESLLRPLAPG